MRCTKTTANCIAARTMHGDRLSYVRPSVPPSPCTRVRGIINTLETRVSSIGGCNNKRSGRPPMQVGGAKKGGGGGAVRANEGLTAVQTQSSTNKLRDKEQRQEQRQDAFGQLPGFRCTHTRGVCVMCEKRSKKYTKKSIKKRGVEQSDKRGKSTRYYEKRKRSAMHKKLQAHAGHPLTPVSSPPALHLLLFAFSQRS